MIGLVCFLAVVGAAVGRQAGHGHEVYNNYCYQCEYVPPKATQRTEYITEEYEEKIPTTKVHCWYTYQYQGEGHEAAGRADADCSYHTPDCEQETTYEVIKKTRQVPHVVTDYSDANGFKHCAGPINHKYAVANGVDIWECHGNCYMRTNDDGSIYRGCYDHEIGVNQNLFGCHQQTGGRYCFCKGRECNGWRYDATVGEINRSIH